MRRWWLVVALVLSLGVNIGILASLAVHRGPAHHRPDLQRESFPPREAGRGSTERPRTQRWRLPQAPLERLADRLGLSGEKRDQFLAVQRQFFTETIAARRGFMEARRELHRELVAEHPDAAKIEKLSNAVGEQVTALDRSLAKTVLASRKILDQRQLEIYLGFLRRLEERGRGPAMAGRRPGPSGPRRAPGGPNGPPPGP